MLLPKRKYLISVKHIVEDYEIEFTKLIKDMKTLERVYSLNNLKVFLKTSKNIKKEDYINLMKANPRLTVDHTEVELLSMTTDEIKNIYDINNYEQEYTLADKSNYSTKYTIEVENKRFKKRKGKIQQLKSTRHYKEYEDYNSFLAELKVFKEVGADITVSVNENEITFAQYLKVINETSDQANIIPRSIKNKDDLITYIRDLAKIREILD